MILAAILTFVAGALYEAGCVGFIHYSERGRAVAAALCSMLTAACEVTGIFEAIHDLRLAGFFVVGFGVGTYAAVRWKDRIITVLDRKQRLSELEETKQ